MIITYDTTTYMATSDEGISTTDISFNHEIEGQNNCLLVAIATASWSTTNCRPGKDPLVVTYGGTALENIEQTTSTATSDGVNLSLWRLNNAGAGTAEIAIQIETTSVVMARAVSYNNCIITTDVIEASQLNYTYPPSSNFTTNISVTEDGMVVGLVASATDATFDPSTNGEVNAVKRALDNSTDATHIARDFSMSLMEIPVIQGSGSVDLGWEDPSTVDGPYIAAVLTPLSPGISDKKIHYYFDVWDPLGQIRDAYGKAVQPWEIRTNTWIKITGLLNPGGKVFEDFYKNPELAYIEEVTIMENGLLRFKTSKSDLSNIVFARLARQRTL
jgi:hypothetical protein